jgi:rod shape-determining protein MreD
MNKLVRMSVAIVLAVVCEASFLPVHILAPFKPDLLLIVVVYLALRGPFGSGAPAAWGLGLLKDVFSGLYLGLNAVTFLIIFLFIKHVSERLYAESAPLFVLTVAVATLACVSSNLLLLLMFTTTPGIAYSMAAGLIPHLLVNAFCASLITLIPGFERPLEAP